MKKCYSLFATLLILFTAGLHQNAKAQLVVDTTISVSTMMEDFFDGTCVSISNVTYTGVNSATGFFDASLTNLGINAGFIMTSGSVYSAVGPNQYTSVSTGLNIPGDGDLSILSGQWTNDASVIEMDIVPSVDTLFFVYSFGSEEYTEWVGSPYNDVFAFYVSGPGITGTQNIALVPGNSDPVSVNSINCLYQNQSYYVCNETLGPVLCPSGCPATTTIEYDGFTVPLTAAIPVTAGETYHVKLAIADAADNIYDSGIFIGVESLCGDGQLKPIADFLSQVNGNTASFNNLSRYGTSYVWDFGDNATSADKNPVHEYAADGLYPVTLAVQNYCCTSFMTGQVQIGFATGIPAAQDLSVNIYPNPTTGILTVELPNQQSGIVKVFDYTGKELKQFQIHSTSDIDLSALPKGVLFLEVISEGKVYIKKAELK